MTTVVAVCQFHVTGAQNAVLEGPSEERAIKGRHENAAWTEEQDSDSGYGHKCVFKLDMLGRNTCFYRIYSLGNTI